MDKQIFRQGTVQVERALFSGQMMRWMVLEVVASAVVVGVWQKSLAMGLIFFIILVAALMEPLVRKWLGIAFSICWAVVGGFLGSLSGEVLAIPAAAAIGGLFGFACHTFAFQWMEDFR